MGSEYTLDRSHQLPPSVALQPLAAHVPEFMYPRPAEQSFKPPIAFEIPGTNGKYVESADPSPPLLCESVTYENIPSQWFWVLGITICSPSAEQLFALADPRVVTQLVHP